MEMDVLVQAGAEPVDKGDRPDPGIGGTAGATHAQAALHHGQENAQRRALQGRVRLQEGAQPFGHRREFNKALRKFRDEPPSHLALEGYIAAKAMVEALRSGLNGRPQAPVRREDVQAALLRSTQHTTGLATADVGMTNTRSGKPIDVTMVRGDGTLIR